jgi:enterochelin esterase-like enzyme
MMTKAIPVRAMMLATLLAATAAPAQERPLPRVPAGEIVRLAPFASDRVPPRAVDVWLPPGYDDTGQYAVVYMHDGEVLFDAELSWNGMSWDAAGVAARLMAAGEVREFLIVAIPNAGAERWSEYTPQRPFEDMHGDDRARFEAIRRERAGGAPETTVRSDAYVAWLVDELKPRIDARFATSPAREDTFIAGSSMGGLISLYALVERPGVFGGAACLSTHWPVIFTLEDNPFPDHMLAYLQGHLPDVGPHRLYFDRGTEELDALYAGPQQRVDELFRSRHWTPEHFVSRVYEGAGHNENAWQARLDVPLRFLLGPGGD